MIASTALTSRVMKSKWQMLAAFRGETLLGTGIIFGYKARGQL